MKPSILSLMLLFSACQDICHAALNASTSWEARPGTGSDTNSGGFGGPNIGNGGCGTDYTQSATPAYRFTDLASSNGTNPTPSVTSASHMFTPADVCNTILVSAGTNWTVTGGAASGCGAQGCYYSIKSTSAGAAVLDRPVGTSASLSGGTWVEGGAMASPSIPINVAPPTNLINVKCDGTYNVTLAAAGVSGGTIFIPNPGADSSLSIIGYLTTHGDNACQVAIKVGANLQTPVTVFSMFAGNATPLIANFSIDCQALAGQANAGNSTQGFLLRNGNYYNLSATDCTNGGITGTVVSSPCAFCSVTNSTTVTQFTFGGCFACEVAGGSSTAFASVGSGATALFSIAHDIAGSTSDCFVTNGAGNMFLNDLGYNCGRHGLNVGSGGGLTIAVNNIMEGNGQSSGTGYGYIVTNSAINNIFLNNAAGLNQTGAITFPGSSASGTLSVNLGFITYTATAFMKASEGNFRLNSNNPGGAQLRSAGLPGFMPDATNRGYATIGPLYPTRTAGSVADSSRRSYQQIEAMLVGYPQSIRLSLARRIRARAHIPEPSTCIPNWVVFMGAGALVAGAFLASVSVGRRLSV